MSEAYFVKVRGDGEKRFRFLAAGGRETRLRVHAVMFDKDRAGKAVRQLAVDNPGFEFRAVKAGGE
jgi:uncharacterized protein YfaS (alpha-2-macroglobulin family)